MQISNPEKGCGPYGPQPSFGFAMFHNASGPAWIRGEPQDGIAQELSLQHSL